MDSSRSGCILGIKILINYKFIFLNTLSIKINLIYSKLAVGNFNKNMRLVLIYLWIIDRKIINFSQ